MAGQCRSALIFDSMTDVYTEDTDDYETQLGALERLRAELARLASDLEHRIHASASDMMDETRFFARKAQHRINSQLGTSALVAIGAGLVLGLLAAALFAHRASRGR
jgi:hypothetical protein